MSIITHIANVETTTAIWEYNPTLPGNRVLGDSLDVVVAVRTLAIKIQASGQRIACFELTSIGAQQMPINLFPITSIQHPGHTTKHIPWTAFMFKCANWERVNDTRIIISNANTIQYFSYELQPTLWHAIPAFEELQMAWEAKRDAPKYALFREAIKHGLTKVGKYYNKFDDKPVYMLALILHPYYKLAYIKMAWGGPEEQRKE
ncbi:hypothetical protein BS17DRAFT_817003 [Gyrodon lividus]|nr:hypothetical protein BS17DRAFT_817003 [Gyrodon lividus]